MTISRSLVYVSLPALLALLSACEDAVGEANHETPAREVGYIVAAPSQVPVVQTYSGRVVAAESSEVRPQIGGIIQRRFFSEGGVVQAGDPLFQIDPSLYETAVAKAQADLEQVKANEVAASSLAARYQRLSDAGAISDQELTNAVAQARSASASVAQAKAALETAKINLRFTRVPAPITGRIGRSLLTPGALASPNQAEPLAIVHTVDPILIDIQQSATELLSLRRAISSGRAESIVPEVSVILPDGSEYEHKGKLEVSEIVVDEATGAVTVRARVPNPEGVLMPGMFVRAAIVQSQRNAAFLVPQQAVMRDPSGRPSVFVVNQSNRVELRAVNADETSGSNWVVTSGLTGGERVVTQGVSRVAPDTLVEPVPEATPQALPWQDAQAGPEAK